MLSADAPNVARRRAQKGSRPRRSRPPAGGRCGKKRASRGVLPGARRFQRTRPCGGDAHAHDVLGRRGVAPAGTLSRSVGGVAFPNWRSSHGWRPVGVRQGEVRGRPARTTSGEWPSAPSVPVDTRYRRNVFATVPQAVISARASSSPPTRCSSRRSRDIVGLYLNPPDAAVALCVDEKAQVQALERLPPILPLLILAQPRRALVRRAHRALAAARGTPLEEGAGGLDPQLDPTLERRPQALRPAQERRRDPPDACSVLRADP